MTKLSFFNVLLIISAIMFLPFTTKAQVTIGGYSTPHEFSILELISSGERGFRLPQLTIDQRNDMGVQYLTGNDSIAAMGLQIFNTTNFCVETWNGREWISLCEGDDPDPCARANGVMIAGVCWARSNVDLSTSSGFAASPYSAGMYFRWGNNRGWRGYGEAAWWDRNIGGWVAGGLTNAASAHSLTPWNLPVNEQGPCPTGWRLPTQAELQALNNSGNVCVPAEAQPYPGVAGRIYGTTNAGIYNPANHVFLPANHVVIPFTSQWEGRGQNVGTNGLYWSGTPVGSGAHHIHFVIGGGSIVASSGRDITISVRCVRIID